MRSPRRSPHTVPPEPAPEAVSPDPCLSFCLIRGRTAAFTGRRVRPVDAGHAPCRPLANTRAQSSKALESVLLSPRISTRRARTPRTGAVSDSGSGMGAEAFRQLRSDAVYEADRRSLTCADACEQTLRTPACPVRDEVLLEPVAPNCLQRAW